MPEFTLLNRAREQFAESGVNYTAKRKNVRRKLKGSLSRYHGGTEVTEKNSTDIKPPCLRGESELHHDLFHLPGDGMLHFFEIAFHQIQTVHARFEFARQFGEEGRQTGVFELVELGDDVIALLPSPNEIDKVLQPLSPQAVVVDALGKHSGEEQGVIANVLADLALAVKGRRRPVNGIGLQQHLAHVVQRTPSGIANLVQLLALAELRENVDDVILHFGIAQSDVTIEVVVNQFGEQPLQRVRFWNHGLGVRLLRLPISHTDVM